MDGMNPMMATMGGSTGKAAAGGQKLMAGSRAGTGSSGGLLRPSVSARANGNGSAGMNGMGGSMASGTDGGNAQDQMTEYLKEIGSLPSSSPSPSTQMNSRNSSAVGNSNGA